MGGAGGQERGRGWAAPELQAVQTEFLLETGNFGAGARSGRFRGPVLCSVFVGPEAPILPHCSARFRKKVEPLSGRGLEAAFCAAQKDGRFLKAEKRPAFFVFVCFFPFPDPHGARTGPRI